jgi:hypothetical protein
MKCEHCGAPLHAAPGSSAVCSYCGATATVPAGGADAGTGDAPPAGQGGAAPPASGDAPRFRGPWALALFVLGILALIAFFIAMQLCTAGELADP